MIECSGIEYNEPKDLNVINAVEFGSVKEAIR